LTLFTPLTRQALWSKPVQTHALQALFPPLIGFLNDRLQGEENAPLRGISVFIPLACTVPR
jgi:hypothetical protein